MLEALTLATFSACLGSRFRLDLGGTDPWEMELIEATDLGAHSGRRPSPARRDPFSIVFRGPRAPCLPQRIYRVEHDRLGTLEIFLVPIGPDGQGMRYEAIFT